MTAPRQRGENAPRSDVETSSARKSCEGFTIADLATPIEEFERLVARRFGLGQLQAAMKAATIRGALRDLAQEGAKCDETRQIALEARLLAGFAAAGVGCEVPDEGVFGVFAKE